VFSVIIVIASECVMAVINTADNTIQNV